MKTSLNQINRELKEIAQAHDQINSYHWGDISDAMVDPINYPLMNCFVQSGGGFQNNATDIPLVVEIYDLVYKDSSNIDDVESDTKQILRDIYQVINKSTRWKKIGRVNTVTDAKYKWVGADDVAGWAQNISFKLRDVSGVCALPMEGYDFEQDPNNTNPCAEGVVLLDSTPLASVPSGEVVDLHLVDQNNATITPISLIGGVIKVDQTPLPAPPSRTAQLMKTAQTQTFVTGDDGYFQSGRPTDFTTISENNVFSNPNRFTDNLGGQTYAVAVVIDWSTWSRDDLTVLGYTKNYDFAASNAAAITAALAVSIGTYTTGWRLTNKKELENLYNLGLVGSVFNYAPFNFPNTINLTTSTTWMNGTSDVYIAPLLNGTTTTQDKTAGTWYIACRTFTWNGTTLT